MSRARYRVGPVHWQSLETTLEPIVQYLYGHMLDAGCGSRDIRSFLFEHGTERVTRYDLESDDPEVVRGPLEQMPFEDGSFDSVLCNAVLEHVVDAQAAMAEIVRVVRPGGHVVAAVPFLQPYHAAPGDYRRYTGDGLAALGVAAGLEVVLVRGVHSFAQTLGWLVWAHAEEKGGRVRRALAWRFAYLLTRWRTDTDEQFHFNANSFQAVYRKPLREGAE